MSASSAKANRLPHSRDLTPSAFVRECAEQVVRASGGKPILDAACGSGRNGLYVASLGCEVIFIDRDLTRLHDRNRLFPRFAASLVPGAYLLLETVPGCGRNYRELPKTGRLQRELAENFDIEKYRERAVGPPGIDAVAVRLLARKRSECEFSSVEGNRGTNSVAAHPNDGMQQQIR